MTSVLVTGGCGFIGTWVVRELVRRNMKVVVLDTGDRPARWDRVIGRQHQEVILARGSLLDREFLADLFAQHAFTNVIHLAALLTPACQTDPMEGCRVNVLGTVALFEQLRSVGDRLKGFSYASSVAVFGDEPENGANRGEIGELALPLTFYGVFKKTVELLADQYWRHFAISSVGIRPQVVYGPERDVGLTAGPSLAVRAAAMGGRYCIGYTGKVGYDYVDDVALAFVRGALETPSGAQVVDLSGEAADVNDVIAAITEAVPGSSGRIAAKGPSIPAHAPVKPRYIETLFADWQTTSLIEGMKRTAAFYRA